MRQPGVVHIPAVTGHISRRVVDEASQLILHGRGSVQRFRVGLAGDPRAIRQIAPGINRKGLAPLRAVALSAGKAIQPVIAERLRPRASRLLTI
jgi:hypothetical protein